MEEKLIVIKTLTEFKKLADYIKDKDYIAFDCETTGVLKSSTIIGFSICADVAEGYYVVLSYWDPISKTLINLETLEFAKEFLNSLLEKNLIMHNGTFDCARVEDNFKIHLLSALHTDTLVLAHLLDENRHNGLKELGVSIYGEDAKKEQMETKESVTKNGGLLTKDHYELYKADPEVLGRYGAKDALLTLKLFYEFTIKLYQENLDTFFYDDESMPLLKSSTYDLNTVGLRVDSDKLQILRGELESQCLELKASIYKEITQYVKEKYPGTSKAKTFNIGSNKQLSWLLFFYLKNEFNTLTKEGKNLCKQLDIPVPYSFKAKSEFITLCEQNHGRVYEESKWNNKTKRISRPKKVTEPWNYVACDKAALQKCAKKYKWVQNLLDYAKNLKLLNTYVIGIQQRMVYNVIRPSFLQHGTTSGRYSSKNPNFQNLPRDDKRIKSCIVARPGKVFIGSDYSQLEPRVFASFSKDIRLLDCFKSGNDFYSTIGMEVFDKYDCVPLKEGSDEAFGVKYKALRQISKEVALAATYGTTAFKMSSIIKKTPDEAQEIINSYFEKFPSVRNLMLESHELVKTQGYVSNLFGRKRRIPAAKSIKSIYGNTDHSELPYEVRNLLNLSINHRIQSTGASIINRAAIAVKKKCKELAITDPLWAEVRTVLQIHDELVLEGPESIAEDIKLVLKDCMENTTILPGITLEAIPKIAKNLADLK
jgi:DNA polymerase I-like protein with 3'-5' exonuclease and polymerase domains